jgi:uncharacterized phage protein (TIGR01671 family)
MDINFKFWNKKDKQMVDWSTLNQFDEKNNFDILQFIGLNDKNKKPIHSGHICKVQLPMGGFWGNVKTEKIGVVEYNKDICAFVIRWEWSRNQHYIQLNCDLEIEIIGNIYENPELLLDLKTK